MNKRLVVCSMAFGALAAAVGGLAGLGQARVARLADPDAAFEHGALPPNDEIML